MKILKYGAYVLICLATFAIAVGFVKLTGVITSMASNWLFPEATVAQSDTNKEDQPMRHLIGHRTGINHTDCPNTAPAMTFGQAPTGIVIQLVDSGGNLTEKTFVLERTRNKFKERSILLEDFFLTGKIRLTCQYRQDIGRWDDLAGLTPEWGFFCS